MNNESLNKSLTDKEMDFCCNYINTGNIKESAIKAGFIKSPEKTGTKLIRRKEVNEEIEKMYEVKQRKLLNKACSGYERLAFGGISDAIRLLYIDDPQRVTLENMDLFNISEIKKVKGGGVEIKFFDRIKALEKLENLRLGGLNDDNSFYSALEHSATLLERND